MAQTVVVACPKCQAQREIPGSTSGFGCLSCGAYFIHLLCPGCQKVAKVDVEWKRWKCLSCGKQTKNGLSRLAWAVPTLARGELIFASAIGMTAVRRLGNEQKNYCVVAATDKRLIIVTRKIGGREVLDYAYPMLTSIDYKRGMALGSIVVAAAGRATEITMVPAAMAEAFTQRVRTRLDEMRAPETTRAPATAPRSDPVEEIRKYAALREEGLITADEFDAKKKQLLGL